MFFSDYRAGKPCLSLQGWGGGREWKYAPLLPPPRLSIHFFFSFPRQNPLYFFQFLPPPPGDLAIAASFRPIYPFFSTRSLKTPLIGFGEWCESCDLVAVSSSSPRVNAFLSPHSLLPLRDIPRVLFVVLRAFMTDTTPILSLIGRQRFPFPLGSPL